MQTCYPLKFIYLSIAIALQSKPSSGLYYGFPAGNSIFNMMVNLVEYCVLPNFVSSNYSFICKVANMPWIQIHHLIDFKIKRILLTTTFLSILDNVSLFLSVERRHSTCLRVIQNYLMW